MTIGNDFQPLTIVKISAEFLNPHMITKDGYINTVNIFEKIQAAFSTDQIDVGQIQNTYYQIDFNFHQKQKGPTRYAYRTELGTICIEMILAQDNITNENTCWIIIIFKFESVIIVFIFECYL